jgi:hypothetical protein
MVTGMTGGDCAARLRDERGEEAQFLRDLLAAAAGAADLRVGADEELEFLATVLASILENGHMRLLHPA